MAEVKPMMIQVETLKYHTNAGKEYQVGDTYDVADHAVESLAANGFAVRVDRAAHAKKTAAPATPAKKSKKR